MNFLSLLKTVGYAFNERPLKLEKPIVLQFPVIDICNSQCQMCRIWENKKSEDISVDELSVGLENPLFSEVVAVGINGGEPTLRKDLADLVKVIYDKLPKVKSISLITNGYRYEEVIKRIEEVGKVVQENNGYLDLMVSLDGYRDVHDKVRGKPGNFDRAQKVIDFAIHSKLINNLRIGCTVIKENIYNLEELLDFCKKRDLYIKYRLGIPHKRLYTENLLDPFAINAAEKYHLVEFLEGLITHYEKSDAQKFFYRSLIDQIVSNSPRKAGCDWQHRGATITSKGELLYCAVQSKVLGNIKNNNSQEIYFSNQEHLRWIVENKCGDCNHDYVGIPPRKEYFKQLSLKFAKKINAESFIRRSYFNLINSSYLRSYLNYKRIKNLISEEQDVSWPSEACRRRVLICGWYGTETLGDKAILAGIVNTLKEEVENIDIVLVSLYPYVSEMTRSQMRELNGIHIVDAKKGVSLAALADLIVLGGGPLMAINETAEILAIFKKAKDAGKKTLIAGCGVGPLGDGWVNKNIIEILRNSDARIYRDEKSKITAKSLGLDVSLDLVAEDPAFTWLESIEQDLNDKPIKNEEKVLLLGLRDHPYKQYAKKFPDNLNEEFKKKYENSVVSALEELIEKFPNLIIKPLPMCTNHFGDDDRWFYRKLFLKKEKIIKNLDFSLLNKELSPIEYCNAFAGATVALTMRFHSVVFAIGLKVPSVAIDYTLGEGKVYALTRKYGIPACSLNELTSDFIVKEVVDLINCKEKNIKKYKYEFKEAMKIKLRYLLSK